MNSLKDWELYNRYSRLAVRLGLKDPNEWLTSIHEEYPTLEKLYTQGRINQYNDLCVLLGLSYENYAVQFTIVPLMRQKVPDFLSNEIASVQPMSAPTGTIFLLK